MPREKAGEAMRVATRPSRNAGGPELDSPKDSSGEKKSRSNGTGHCRLVFFRDKENKLT